MQKEIKKRLKAQYVTAILHMIIVVMCVVDAVRTSYDALWETVWSPLFYIDLPVTILLVVGNQTIPENIKDTLGSIVDNTFSTFPYSSFWSFWWPTMLYGILGTLLWFYIPRLFQLFVERLRQRDAMNNQNSK